MHLQQLAVVAILCKTAGQMLALTVGGAETS